MNKAELFERSPVVKAALALAVPTVISQLIMMIYNLADTFFVGQVNDPDQLAAITLAMPLQLTMTALANLFGIGGSAVLARALGAGKTDQARQASAFALYGAIAVMAVCSLSSLLFRGGLLRLLGSTPRLDTHLASYAFWVFTIGGFLSVFNMAVSHLIRGEGASTKASFGLSMGGIVNMILDPFFILPFGLGLGIRGAAIATCLANLLTCVYFLCYLLRNRESTVVTLSPASFRLDRELMAGIFSSGLPSAIQSFMSTVSNVVLNHILVGYGETVIAGLGICKKVDSIPAYTIMGFAQGTVPLVAYNYGAGNRERMRKAFHFSLMAVLGIAVFFLAVYELGADVISSWFIRDTETIAVGAEFTRIHILAIPFMAVTTAIISFFQAVKRGKAAFSLSLIRKGLFDVPLMFLMDLVLPLYGPVFCQPIMDAVSAATAVFLYRGVGKRQGGKLSQNE